MAENILQLAGYGGAHLESLAKVGGLEVRTDCYVAIPYLEKEGEKILKLDSNVCCVIL